MSTSNPVLLWGDHGPKVYASSQIYDPERSAYVPTVDTHPVAGKTYYKRERVDDTISFNEVIGLTEEDNPKQIGLFENVEGTDQEGTYVPVVDSLVVVNEYDTDFQEGTLLRVVAVDETTLKSTLRPITYSSGTEASPRAVDYGNERFMLFFDEHSLGTGRVVLTPDRKLMMYGRNEYYYKLYRKGVCIASTLPDGIKPEGNANIPYVSAASKRVNFATAAAIEAEAGNYADVYNDRGLLVNLLIPLQIDGEELDTTALLPSLDTYFKEGGIYFLKNGDEYNRLYFSDVYETTHDTVAQSGKVYYQKQVSGAYVVKSVPVGGDVAGLYEKTHAKSATIGAEVGPNVYQKAREVLLGRIGYVYNKTESILAHVYVPTSCQLDADKTIVNGELIDMEVYELRGTSYREVMNVTLVAKSSMALDMADVTTRRVRTFEVLLNGQDHDIWYLTQGDNIKNWSITPRLVFDDSSTMNIPIDNKSSFVFGLDAIKTDMVGKEYRIMFKFFPNARMNFDWTQFKTTPTMNYITCYKTVKIIEGLSNSVRKVSLIPVWNNAKSKYEFRYLIYRQDLQQPRILSDIETGDLDTMIKYVKPEEDTVQANTVYYRLVGSKYMPTELVVGEAMPDDVFVQETVPGVATTIDGRAAMFGHVQHAAIAVQVQGPNSTVTEIYKQPIGIKLQNMVLSSVPKKWLIGDDVSGYEEALLPYGNDTNGKRPYLKFTKDTDAGGLENGLGIYQVDVADFNDESKFLEAFYRNALPPVGSYHLNHQTYEDPIQPTHFILRSPCDPLVVSAPVQISADLEVTGKPYAYPCKLSLGPKVTDPDEGTYYKDDSVHAVGGHIPSQYSDATLGTVDVMGTVIMEFVYKTSSGEFKHLYGVPVEVRQA